MHHFHDLSSRVRDAAPCLAGCDIRVRLILALAAIVAIVMSTSIAFELVAIVCSLVGLAATGTPPKVLALRLMGPLVLAALVLAMQTFMTGTTPLA